GVILGTSLLVNLPPEPMLIALAGFVFVFAMRSLLNLHGDKLISRGWAVPASLAGGTVGALFGTGGPPYVIYLSHRIRDKSELRATFSALFFTEGLTRIGSFLVAGLLMTASVWVAFFAALPLVLGALYLGGRVHVGIGPAQMARLVGVLLLVSSVSLLFKALSR
ncbi:MAG: TSUP family transporter, partial [Gammaproteobacteria bacterium]|nr:TSUP family transporter [Gammaproteobacteria bacterium]